MAWILGIIASSVQKAYTIFSDTFNRTSSGSLGTSSSGGAWDTVRGTWTANGASANTNDAANTYPLSSITMSSADVTASISTGEGATLIASSGTVGSIASGNGTTGAIGFHWATVTVSSTTGVNVGDWIFATAGTGTLYGGTPDFVEVTSIVANTSISYRIKGGTVPTAGTVSNIYTRGKDGGSGLSLWVTDSGNWFGVLYGRSIDTSCNCSQCGLGTYSCNGWSPTSSCNSWTQGCASYTCTYSNYSSSTQFQSTTGNWFPVFAWAPACSTYQGQSCSSFCSGGYAFAGYICSSSVQNTGPCNCQTCYPPYISVIKSVSSVVSEVTRWTLASMAAAFKVITNSTSKIITIRPYKEQSMTTQIGADLTSDLSAIATTTKKFGIVLAPSDQIQGKNLDDFNITKN